MSRRIVFIFGLFWIWSSCELIDVQDIEVGMQQGVRPIYAENEVWDEVKSLPPQPIGNLGKIYYKAPYIFVNERFRGIHVLDNTDPSDPTAVVFIQIYGCEDIAISGNILYADNYTDLVVIDISDLNNVKEVDRIKDLYTREQKRFPDGYSGYFECVDAARGFVVGWEEVELMNPECRR